MQTSLSAPKVLPRTRSPALLLGSLCLLQAATGFNWSAYFAFGGIFLRAKLGLSVEAIALLVSSAFLTYCVIQFGVSLVVDVGVRVVGLTGSLGNALLVVAALFGVSAAVWWRHLARGEAQAEREAIRA